MTEPNDRKRRASNDSDAPNAQRPCPNTKPSLLPKGSPDIRTEHGGNPKVVQVHMAYNNCGEREKANRDKFANRIRGAAQKDNFATSRIIDPRNLHKDMPANIKDLSTPLLEEAARLFEEVFNNGPGDQDLLFRYQRMAVEKRTMSEDGLVCKEDMRGAGTLLISDRAKEKDARERAEKMRAEQEKADAKKAKKMRAKHEMAEKQEKAEQERSDEKKANEKKAKEEKAAEEESTEEEPIEEKAKEEQAERERLEMERARAERERIQNENAAKEKAAKEKAAEEEAAKRKAAEEQTAEEKAAIVDAEMEEARPKRALIEAKEEEDDLVTRFARSASF